MASPRLRAASLVLAVTALAHSGLGELFVLRRLRQVRGLPRLAPWVLVPSPAAPGGDTLTMQTLRFTWHLASLLGGAFALILGRNASREQLGPEERFVVGAISTTLGLCAAAVFATTGARHPGWLPFLAAAILARP